MNKQEALARIKDLEEYIEGLDKKKTVLVYVRKNAKDIKPKGWDPTFAPGMERYLGTEIELVLHNQDLGVFHGAGWKWAPEWFVVLEGDLADLPTK